MSFPPPPRLALVGDRSAAVRSHAAIPKLLASLSGTGSEAIEPYWMSTKTITAHEDVTGFNGIWVVPGSPYESMTGALIAIEAARCKDIPLLGTCGGFQHLLVEFARNVCGLADATSAEIDPNRGVSLITPLICELYGEESEVIITPGTGVATAMGAGRTTERYFCRYGLSPTYEKMLTSHGLVVSGRDANGEVRVVEIPDRPFFVGTLFQPELSSDTTWIHPLIVAFSEAIRARADRTAVST